MDKTVPSAAAAVADIPDRARLAVGGFGLCGIPSALIAALLEDIAHFQPLSDQIESFWLEPSHREFASWRDHRDINDVMLATSLAPAGYIGLGA